MAGETASITSACSTAHSDSLQRWENLASHKPSIIQTSATGFTAPPWWSHMRHSGNTNHVCLRCTKSADTNHDLHLCSSAGDSLSNPLWLDLLRGVVEMWHQMTNLVTLYISHQPGHMLQGNRWVNTHSLIQRGGESCGLWRPEEHKSGGGARIWRDTLKDLHFLFSVRLDKQWSARCLTLPHPHVTGQKPAVQHSVAQS